MNSRDNKALDEMRGLNPNKIETLVCIELDSAGSIPVYTDMTIQKIYEELNQDKKFIQIGESVIKCSSIISIFNTGKENS